MEIDLFRPVGLRELALCWDLGMRAFPPRLPGQPIFYPVLTLEYARTIARDWNTRDSNSGFSGFVTHFRISEAYLAKFEPHRAGSSEHLEYWIPADQMPIFNAAIQGLITIEEAFFGDSFEGWVPENFGLKGKDAATQFVAMARAWDYSSMDFVCEVSTSRKTIYLNFLFWSHHNFAPLGIEPQQKAVVLDKMKEAWKYINSKVPLPNP